MNKDCPYQHKESKDQDILTPDDMQKKALFQYCQQLAISISKIADMTEAQFRSLIKDKIGESSPGDGLAGNFKTSNVLPGIESIFENKDLINKINIIRYQLQQSKTIKESLTEPTTSGTKIK